MHPLDADALCAERCGKPPQPWTGPQSGRVCINCKRPSAHSLLCRTCAPDAGTPAEDRTCRRCNRPSAHALITPGLCRDCAYPSGPPDAA